MHVEDLKNELTINLLPVPRIVIIEGFDWEQMNSIRHTQDRISTDIPDSAASGVEDIHQMLRSGAFIARPCAGLLTTTLVTSVSSYSW